MAQKHPDVPAIKLHKASSQAYVILNGRRRYLGRFGSADTDRKYHRTIREWKAGGRKPLVSANDLSVVELAARFWAWSQQYYRQPDGKPTSELANIAKALKPLKELYGDVEAVEFGPLALKAVRERMIGQGWSRGWINRSVDRIRRAFRWAVAEELIQASVYEALRAVPGLKRGRSEAREAEPIKPVPIVHIDAVRPNVSRQIEGMIDLQLLTAARPGEIVAIRPIDIAMSDDVWVYSPTRHKNAYRGNSREIFLGPKAQEIIRPFLVGRSVDAFLFSPFEADAERRAKATAKRKTSVSCGNSVGTNRKLNPKRSPQDHYSRCSYRRAVQYACAKVGVPSWCPSQLRHNAATALRKQYGLEIAAIMLGHAKADVTQIYAERDRAKALEVAARIG